MKFNYLNDNKANNYLLGARVNIGYYFSEKTKCALYFDTNLLKLYAEKSGVSGYVRCFGVNISRYISKK